MHASSCDMCSLQCRYGSPSVLEQWLGAVVADASELTDSKVSVGELVSSTVSKE